ncbi:hypothetical protein PF003_g24589 [Phytophthora fragariae]|nr:hypothetical protein PF003_g24589 [Phytophthora fragariae]
MNCECQGIPENGRAHMRSSQLMGSRGLSEAGSAVVQPIDGLAASAPSVRREDPCSWVRSILETVRPAADFNAGDASAAAAAAVQRVAGEA